MLYEVITGRILRGAAVEALLVHFHEIMNVRRHAVRTAVLAAGPCWLLSARDRAPGLQRPGGGGGNDRCGQP